MAPLRFLGIALLLTTAALGRPGSARALAPEEVLVVANRNARDSMDLAAYYLKRRGIPPKNLLGLWVTDSESCARKEYDARIAEPVRRRLQEHNGPPLRAVVLVYGMPLRVLPPEPTREELRTLSRLEQERKELAPRKDTAEATEREQIAARIEALGAEIAALRRSDHEASVDSELALVRVPDHDLKGWLPNPLFLGFRGRDLPLKGEDVLMVSRLDGPSPAVVQRVIDDSLAVERDGLRGTAYLDARWEAPAEGKKLSGYALYDEWLHEAATLLRKRGVPVVLEETQALFPEGSRFPAALYCGWYSLARYVDAFAWHRGAVGYHIASSECATLRRAGGTVWCKRMLEEGVAATLGPVSEPYVQAFPPPNLFFQLLTDGRLALGEAYTLSLPYLSWKMVLVGDPLYRPFRQE